MKVALIGAGWVGKAYAKMFPDAYLYDITFPGKVDIDLDGEYKTVHYDHPFINGTVANKAAINKDCDIALVCVPTNAITEEEHIDLGEAYKSDRVLNKLDMSIVEEVCDWLETPLILIKSALQPGTVDRLLEKYKKQGYDKKIAVSVEMVGEGRYFVPFWKYPHAEDPTYHDFLIIGGEEETAKRCADVLWSKMSPDINIHLVSAIEAEIVKLTENSWGAMKVTFANTIYDICEDMGANYTKVLQAWGADGRTEKMHMRVLPGKRGWKSKCFDKDIPALASLDKSGFLNKLIEVNEQHLTKN